MKHGTESFYQNKDCRCDECVVAHRVFRRKQRQDEAEKWLKEHREIELPPGMTTTQTCGYCQGTCTHDLKSEAEYEIPEEYVREDLKEGYERYN